jgi:xylulokinase
VTHHVLSIDLGTSRVKLGVVSDQLEVLSSATAHYPTYVEKADMAEQRPEEWIGAISQAWTEVRQARPDIHIDAVVLTAQMPTLVELDEKSQVIGRAVTWQDSRAEELVRDRLSATDRNRINEVAGTPIDGRYLIPMYLQRRLVGLPEPATILSAKDYIFYVLTDRRWTDPSTASGFGNYELSTQLFSDELNSLWGFDAQLLPSVKASNSSAPLSPSGVDVLVGLEAGQIPVVLGSADSVAGFHYVEETFGTAIAIIDGSSTVLLSSADETRATHPKLLVTPLVDGARHGVEMDLLATGSSISWLANLFNCSPKDLETLAWAVEDKAANAILFTPYLAGGEQGALWRTDLSAAISNLVLGSSQGDIALSLYEGIAFEVLRCLDVLVTPGTLPTVVWLVSNINGGLLPALVSTLGRYHVVTLPGLSPSLLGAALIALDVLQEKPDLASRRDDLTSVPAEFDSSYVAALSAKRSSYLAAEERAT